jgi:hypothetical protein
MAKNADPSWSGNVKDIKWDSTTIGTRPPGWSPQQIQGSRLPHPGSTCRGDDTAVVGRGDAAGALRKA